MRRSGRQRWSSADSFHNRRRHQAKLRRQVKNVRLKPQPHTAAPLLRLPNNLALVRHRQVRRCTHHRSPPFHTCLPAQRLPSHLPFHPKDAMVSSSATFPCTTLMQHYQGTHQSAGLIRRNQNLPHHLRVHPPASCPVVTPAPQEQPALLPRPQATATPPRATQMLSSAPSCSASPSQALHPRPRPCVRLPLVPQMDEAPYSDRANHAIRSHRHEGTDRAAQLQGE